MLKQCRNELDCGINALRGIMRHAGMLASLGWCKERFRRGRRNNPVALLFRHVASILHSRPLHAQWSRPNSTYPTFLERYMKL